MNGASPPAFSRILLKLSGEALMGELDYGTDPERVRTIAGEVAAVHARGVEVAIVVGGGNIYRGLAAAARGMDRDAEFIPEITHKEALTRGLQVMDSTAFALCMDNSLPIIVFNMAGGCNIDKIVSGERVGTLVRT